MVERSETALLHQTDRYLRECVAQVLTVDPAFPNMLAGSVFSTASGSTHVTIARTAGKHMVIGTCSRATRHARLDTLLTSLPVPPTGA